MIGDMTARFGTLNVHRADCNRNHANPCDPWKERRPRVAKFLREKMKCSVYAWQECLPEQASDLSKDLGWGDAGNPPWWGDQNFNVVAADRDKWAHVKSTELSLWADLDDVGLEHRRSANWVELLHMDSGRRILFGASHLETGNPEARIEQATVLAQFWPAGLPAILGIDRNSFSSSEGDPRWILAQAGISEATPRNPKAERSFNGFGEPVRGDGKCIDGLHYTAMQERSADFHSTAGGRSTDHSGLSMSFFVPGDPIV